MFSGLIWAWIKAWWRKMLRDAAKRETDEKRDRDQGNIDDKVDSAAGDAKKGEDELRGK